MQENRTDKDKNSVYVRIMAKTFIRIFVGLAVVFTLAGQIVLSLRAWYGSRTGCEVVPFDMVSGLD
jgi:hypothetical protein